MFKCVLKYISKTTKWSLIFYKDIKKYNIMTYFNQVQKYKKMFGHYFIFRVKLILHKYKKITNYVIIIISN